MTAIAGEHIEKAPTSAVTKARLKWLAYAALGGLIALAGARYGYDYWTVGRFIESTDDAYAGGNVTPISPHVAGFVAQILVGDNEYVHAGQPLIRLDDRDFRAAADRAAAIVAARKATLESLERKLTMQQTTIRQAKADLDAKTGAGGVRQAGRPKVSRPCADRRRIAAKRGAGVVAEPGGRGQRGFVRGRARRGEAAAHGSWTPRSPSPRPTSPRPRPISTPPNSISATPKFAPRSTAMSAIEPPRSALMSLAAPISSQSFRRMTFGSTPTSRRASLSG